MKNVRLHLDEGIVLNVKTLRGEMVSRDGSPPVFDDPRSYALRDVRGDLTMDAGSLTSLIGRHVFGYEGAPVKDISIELKSGDLVQKGKLRKAGVWIPFSMNATVAATPDGRLQLRTSELRALGVPSTTLLEFLGLTLADLLPAQKERGLEVNGNDVVIAPGRVLPPPRMDGHLSSVSIENGQLHQIFSGGASATAAPLTPPDPKAPNYVYFSGSSIRFGKLLMTGSDLQLIDLDSRDAFDFYPAKYNAQLVAGYSKNTPSGGLRTYMPDYADLRPGTDIRPGLRR